MHPWHDVPVDADQLEDGFPSVIEIPRGSVNKYELDKDTGLLRLDRVLHSAVHYPADYGFIPQTLCEDGDALDVLVIAQEPVHPLTLVPARAIGMFRMTDDGASDDKIVAVSVGDPSVNRITHHEQLPGHLAQQILRFFQDYTALEKAKTVAVEHMLGPEDAMRTVREALEMYARSRASGE